MGKWYKPFEEAYDAVKGVAQTSWDIFSDPIGTVAGWSGYDGSLSDLLWGKGSPEETFSQQQQFARLASAQYQMGTNQAQEQLKRGIASRQAGYQQAQQAASSASRGARRGAMNRAKQAEGVAASRYGMAGGYGTTALDQARAGIRASLSQELESIDSAFAGLLSELSIGEGQSVAQGQTLLANLLQQGGAQQAGISMQLAGLVPQPQEGIAADLIGLGLGALIG